MDIPVIYDAEKINAAKRIVKGEYDAMEVPLLPDADMLRACVNTINDCITYFALVAEYIDDAVMAHHEQDDKALSYYMKMLDNQSDCIAALLDHAVGKKTLVDKQAE